MHRLFTCRSYIKVNLAVLKHASVIFRGIVIAVGISAIWMALLNHDDFAAFLGSALGIWS
jgi:hypothetical protein